MSGDARFTPPAGTLDVWQGEIAHVFANSAVTTPLHDPCV
jgi:hypothetical protein